MTSIRDTPQFQLGHEGERRGVLFFQGLGCGVAIPADYAGENGETVPLLQWAHHAWIVPDLDVVGNGHRGAVDVKVKTKAVYYGVMQRYVHGISLRQHEHYLGYQDATGTPVYLLIIERETGEYLFARLDDLIPNAQKDRRSKEDGGMENGGMIFYKKADFTLVHRTDKPLFDCPIQLSLLETPPFIFGGN